MFELLLKVFVLEPEVVLFPQEHLGPVVCLLMLEFRYNSFKEVKGLIKE